MKGTFAVARRVILSVRGDHRTVGLVFVAPVLIIFLLSEVFVLGPQGERGRDTIAPVLLGFFVYFLTYLITAIGFLRERQGGTLERLAASPVTGAGLVTGYLLGYGALAILQAAVLLGAGLVLLDVTFEHGIALFFMIEILGAFSALGLGILISLFAQNEFQVMQFMPLVIAPQAILGGVFVPVDRLPTFLEIPARALPLTHLLEAMRYVVLGVGEATDLYVAIAVLGGTAILAAVWASLTVRRAA